MLVDCDHDIFAHTRSRTYSLTHKHSLANILWASGPLFWQRTSRKEQNKEKENGKKEEDKQEDESVSFEEEKEFIECVWLAAAIKCCCLGYTRNKIKRKIMKRSQFGTLIHTHARTPAPKYGLLFAIKICVKHLLFICLFHRIFCKQN